jgi:hypothetical protein
MDRELPTVAAGTKVSELAERIARHDPTVARHEALLIPPPKTPTLPQRKKWRRRVPAPREARKMRSSEFVEFEKTYLVSAVGLAPKSRRLLAAVRAARAAGMFAAAAP